MQLKSYWAKMYTLLVKSRIIHLLNDSHLGVVTSAISLIHALSEQQPEKYKQAVGFAANRLSRIVTSTYQGDYTINDNQKFNPNSIKGFTRIHMKVLHEIIKQ